MQIVSSKEEKILNLEIKTFEAMKKKINYKKILNKFREEADSFLEENFPTVDKNIDIIINGRLKRSKGRFVVDFYNKKKSIEINKEYITLAILTNSFDSVIKTLQHELVHYSLNSLNKRFHDGDYDFESKLAELNIPASSSTNLKYVKSDAPQESINLKYVYEKEDGSEIAFSSKSKKPVALINKITKESFLAYPTTKIQISNLVTRLAK